MFQTCQMICEKVTYFSQSFSKYVSKWLQFDLQDFQFIKQRFFWTHRGTLSLSDQFVSVCVVYQFKMNFSSSGFHLLLSDIPVNKLLIHLHKKYLQFITPNNPGEEKLSHKDSSVNSETKGFTVLWAVVKTRNQKTLIISRISAQGEENHQGGNPARRFYLSVGRWRSCDSIREAFSSVTSCHDGSDVCWC